MTKSRKFRTEQEWAACLPPDVFAITRKKGTERAFTGVFNDFHQPGIFACRCCGQHLFASDHKYDSGSGWPSFWQPLETTAVEESADNTHGMQRIEVHCSQCEAHLGHVFPDGPNPTGLRYCINSASLSFNENEENGG